MKIILLKKTCVGAALVTPLLLWVALTSPTKSQAQTNDIKAINQRTLWKADSLRDGYAYNEALKMYNEIYSLGNQDLATIRRIADVYRLMGNSEQAEHWYSMALGKPETEPMDRFYYARALCAEGKYNQAKQNFEIYRDTIRAEYQRMRKGLKAAAERLAPADMPVYVVERLPISTQGEDFSPTIFRNQIIFVSAAGGDLKLGGERKNKASKEIYFDLYTSRRQGDMFTKPKQLGPTFNSPLHEGPACIFNQGRQIMFTRNYAQMSSDGKIKKTDPNAGRLRIYESHLKANSDSVWEPPAMVQFTKSFGKKKASYGHPATTDGKTLYFSSDMGDDAGHTDIYVTRLENGAWQEPQKLGPLVNTSGSEMFPYLAPDGMLYFASDGLGGLGGLDIYRFDLSKEEKPVNLGYPINTEKDDFGPALEEYAAPLAGYLSSNRRRGKSDDDIYRFYTLESDSLYQLAERLSVISVPLSRLTLEKNTAKPHDFKPKISSSANTATPHEDNAYYANGPELPTDRAGLLPAPPSFNDPKTLIVVGEGASARIWQAQGDRLVPYVYTPSSSLAPGVEGKLKPNGQRASMALPEGAETRQIRSVYFEFNQSTVAPEGTAQLKILAEVLRLYPSVGVRIEAHSDSRGSSAFNIGLSARRAEATAAYLLAAGIDRARLKLIPKGEQGLVNRCADHVKCSEAEHRLNRRAEFKLLVSDTVDPQPSARPQGVR